MKGYVLVVDDCESVRDVLRIGLTALGYGVSVAEDGLAALREIRRFTPDVVLLDVVMPRMTGWEMLELLRSGTTQSDLAVVVMTARHDEVASARSWALGCTCHVRKPVDLVEINALLERLIREKKARNRAYAAQA